MKNLINYLISAVIIAALISCKPVPVTESSNLPDMPMKAVYENSLDYFWSQKKVHDSRLLSDAETMDSWEHRGTYGSLSLSDEKPYKGRSSILLESPTKGEQGAGHGGNVGWSISSAFFKVDHEDWTDWNRLTFWIYPDLPGFKVLSLFTVFYNDGEDRVPGMFGRNGNHNQVLENHKWNKVYLEIAHLGREKVAGFEIRYRAQGNEPGATDHVRFFIDELHLEKVDADLFEGWNVQSGRIAYNHAGYAANFPKIAFTSENIGDKFFLKDRMSGKTVKEGVVAEQTTPAGTFRMIDFSDVKSEGEYVLEVGKLKTKPFIIGAFSDVYRNSIIKTLNHFYTQRCGFAIPGIHDACHLDWLCMHGDMSLPVHGGWHDAGDLSQGLVNTGEAAYAMMMVAEKLKQTDPALSDRLLEEAEWGVSWMLRTRFGDGFRSVWATKRMWTDGIHGTNDDVNNNASNDPHANFISAVTQAFAAKAFREKNPFLAAHALKCAIEDYAFGLESISRRMSVETVGAALNVALALFELTSDEFYKGKAFEHAAYIINCQQQDNLDSNVPLKGFFYRTPEKNVIFHYAHRSHEQDFIVGLVKLSQLFPSEAAEWKKAIRLYADFYKEICAYTAPYYMIPAGIYDITQARDEVDTEQIMSGVRLNERY